MQADRASAGEVFGGWHGEVQGVGDTVDDVEVGADVDGVCDGGITEIGGAQRLHICWRDVGGVQGELLQETEHGAQGFADGGCAPVVEDGLHQFA